MRFSLKILVTLVALSSVVVRTTLAKPSLRGRALADEASAKTNHSNSTGTTITKCFLRDSRTCPDGTIRRRQPPSCELPSCAGPPPKEPSNFAALPEEQPEEEEEPRDDDRKGESAQAQEVAAAKRKAINAAMTKCVLRDFRTCPDGTTRRRLPPTCELPSCTSAIPSPWEPREDELEGMNSDKHRVEVPSPKDSSLFAAMPEEKLEGEDSEGQPVEVPSPREPSLFAAMPEEKPEGEDSEEQPPVEVPSPREPSLFAAMPEVKPEGEDLEEQQPVEVPSPRDPSLFAAMPEEKPEAEDSKEQQPVELPSPREPSLFATMPEEKPEGQESKEEESIRARDKRKEAPMVRNPGCFLRDAKTCPNGSVVTRQPPNCELECPPEHKNKPIINDVSSPTTKPESTTSTGVRSPNGSSSSSSNSTSPASASGDPHFKLWTGEKYDYHGECDLVLIDHPNFANGLGLRLHIRTTRIKYFSYIEKAALQIGEDVLEFDNNVENFLINGLRAEPNKKHHKTMLGNYWIRRDPKAISVRLSDSSHSHSHAHGKAAQRHRPAKIDFHSRKNGFPAVIVDGGNTDIFRGSLGLLGEWGTGRTLGRDGRTEILMNGEEDATPFALEWQVRDTEPMLFMESRYPQYPTTCTAPPPLPPALMASFKKSLPSSPDVGGNVRGAGVHDHEFKTSSFLQKAKKACSHWKEEDQPDCIFDVVATMDLMVAAEGHIVHLD